MVRGDLFGAINKDGDEGSFSYPSKQINPINSQYGGD
jgi:hypothetical protein